MGKLKVGKCFFSFSLFIILISNQSANGEMSSQSVKPSFSCLKAKSKIEKSICQNSDLAELDTNLSQKFSEILTISKQEQEKKNKRTNQLEWLKKRNSTCSSGDHDCLKRFYNERLVYFDYLKLEQESLNVNSATKDQDVCSFVKNFTQTHTHEEFSKQVVSSERADYKWLKSHVKLQTFKNLVGGENNFPSYLTYYVWNLDFDGDKINDLLLMSEGGTAHCESFDMIKGVSKNKFEEKFKGRGEEGDCGWYTWVLPYNNKHYIIVTKKTEDGDSYIIYEGIKMKQKCSLSSTVKVSEWKSACEVKSELDGICSKVVNMADDLLKDILKLWAGKPATVLPEGFSSEITDEKGGDLEGSYKQWLIDLDNDGKDELYIRKKQNLGSRNGHGLISEIFKKDSSNQWKKIDPDDLYSGEILLEDVDGDRYKEGNHPGLTFIEFGGKNYIVESQNLKENVWQFNIQLIEKSKLRNVGRVYPITNRIMTLKMDKQ